MSEDAHAPEESKALTSFQGFKVIKTLKQNLSTKSICLLATLDTQTAAASPPPGIEETSARQVPPQHEGGSEAAENPHKDGGKEAVLLLEKSAFSEDTLSSLMSSDTSLDRTMQNDIYGIYKGFPDKANCDIKATVIYPATEKHIQKYSFQEPHLIIESYEDYKTITKPHLDQMQFSIQWVYNILEKKAEADRIVLEDTDPETGFVMLPDMKWDEKQTSDLYLVVIVRPRNVRSLRDLNASHLPLLRNIQEKCINCVTEKYGVAEDQLRMYFHYQPSYYHLHVHVTNLKFDAPGTHVTRAHLLSSVIANIELVPDYYQRVPLSFVLMENNSLLKRFQEAKKADVK
ncbi:m7GpppX diphosphatase-like [Diadema antillarum]|uniref:m7GpppX diphosphatase-like n=1 Tax=Diadema antillarum TaxID=105358 RepID=UPI003A857319